MKLSIEIPKEVRKRLGRNRLALKAFVFGVLFINGSKGRHPETNTDAMVSCTFAISTLLASHSFEGQTWNECTEWWEDQMNAVADANLTFIYFPLDQLSSVPQGTPKGASRAWPY